MASDPTPASDPARFARQLVLPGFGAAAQGRLAHARVLVIGAGGLGSFVIPALAAAGVGSLVIVDDDRVEASNLHRQTIHGVSDVGRLKVESAADAVARISPGTHVSPKPIRFTKDAAPALLDGIDVLVDGSDNAQTRFAANDAAADAGIPLVWGSALRYGAQVGVASEAHGIDYRDLFPDEGAPDELCEVAGVLPTVCGVAGALMASEAIKLITGVGEPLIGRVAMFDALTGRMREIAFTRDPAGRRQRQAAPPQTARTLTAPELAESMARGATPVLLDVREPWEHAIAALPGAVLIPLGELPERLGELASDRETVVYCHHGVRSDRGLAELEAAGFSNARHLEGGIDAWARAVDPTMARY